MTDRFNLSALAVRERAITLFLIIALAASGIYSFVKLGRAEDPAFTVKVLTVTAMWPGATAQEMQDLVAEPMEKRMQELRWFDRVETVTRPGTALMVVTLKDTMPPADVQSEFYQLRKKLQDQAPRLPKGVQGPFVNDEYSDVSFSLFALQAPGLPPRLLTREAEKVRSQLLQVPGVKKVNILGEQSERIFVDLDEAKLHNLQLNPQQILEALSKRSAMTASGAVSTDGPRIHLRLSAGLDDIEAISNTYIYVQGHTLRLGDIATISRGYEDPPSFEIHHNAQFAMLLDVVMQEGYNGLYLGKDLEKAREDIAAALPLGFSLETVTNQSVNIASAVGEFMFKFFAALSVVLLVCLISMGWRVGIVVAAAVPLTLAMVFVIMMMTGKVFDRVTLGALIISLGLLVDDAIIAIEIMIVKMEEGMDRLKAAAYAWNHTAAPMLSGTLVTIIGFLPVGFARSSAGEYAGNIFWILAAALLTSWLVAVAFTPYMGVKLLPAIPARPGGHQAIYDTPNYKRLRRMIAWSVHHKFLVAGIVVGAFVLAVVGMGFVKQQFFPTSDRPELLVEVQLPEGSSIQSTQAVTRKVESWLREQPETKLVTSYTGQGAPRFFLSYNPELPDPSFARLVVLTADYHDRDALLQRFRQVVADGLTPEARVRATQLVFGPSTKYPVEFLVRGPDLDTLRDISEQAMTIMRADKDMRQVNVDWGSRVPVLKLNVDPQRLQALGLNRQSLAEQIQLQLDGATVAEYREDLRNVLVVARSSAVNRHDPTRLSGLTVMNDQGQNLPLEQVGKLEIMQEEPKLARRNRLPTMTVRGDIAPHVQPAEVANRVMKEFASLQASLPPGYLIEMSGITAEAKKSNDALLPVFPVMIALMLLVIVIQVRSLSNMIMVFLTAPLGLIGSVPALLIFQQPFGFTAILGLIGLAGILMRNTLILIEQIKTNRAEGASPYDAVIEATVQRARPVILTALAAVLAFIPLSFSVFWGSMALTLIGGTAIGTILTLLFLPSLYSIWNRIQDPRVSSLA
ncbi:MAG: efflux RND transporter permease subunit [Alcaligenes sp.]|uniref:efflux RND transporter permease subunit n=1 Tax=Alcaligenes aquatilis TaxID=323284 RepID=UPI00355CAF6C